MSFSLWAVIADAFREEPTKNRQRFEATAGGECNCNSRTHQALGLHSCRALSSRACLQFIKIREYCQPQSCPKTKLKTPGGGF